MDKTLWIALISFFVGPFLVAALQNLVMRQGKKDDVILVREELMLKREEALEKKRERHLEEKEDELIKALAEIERLKKRIAQYEAVMELPEPPPIVLLPPSTNSPSA